MQVDSDRPIVQPTPDRKPSTIIQPDFSRSLKLISDLVEDTDFPRSALGEFVDIGGYSGVVVEIVKESLKVKSPEGATKSFNVHGLRRIYGRVVHPEPEPVQEEVIKPTEQARPPAAAKPKAPANIPPPAPAPVVLEPDFSKPVKDIASLVVSLAFPDCVLGEHVEMGGYTGVVVQIVNRSLKVRSQAGTTRSYNADALRRLHAR